MDIFVPNLAEHRGMKLIGVILLLYALTCLGIQRFHRSGGSVDTMRMRTQSKPKYESNLQRAIRKIRAQGMSVGDSFTRHDGITVHPVNGYLLTTEQIVELDSKNQLTSWGIREFGARPMCPVHKLEMRQTDIRDAAPGVSFYACPDTGCDSRFSDKTGYISVFDLPSR